MTFKKTRFGDHPNPSNVAATRTKLPMFPANTNTIPFISPILINVLLGIFMFPTMIFLLLTTYIRRGMVSASDRTSRSTVGMSLFQTKAGSASLLTQPTGSETIAQVRKNVYIFLNEMHTVSGSADLEKRKTWFRHSPRWSARFCRPFSPRIPCRSLSRVRCRFRC